jgi:hypothetical protein
MVRLLTVKPQYFTNIRKILLLIKYFLTRKSSGGHQAKKKKGEKNLSPRNRKACHSTNTALLKSVAEIRTQKSCYHIYVIFCCPEYVRWLTTLSDLGARRRRSGGGPGGGCARKPVGTYLRRLRAMGVGTHVAVPCLAR